MYRNKKVLLILGAISAMNEIVQNARKKGYYVIVTDNLIDSPAKKYADESWMLSIDDVDGLVAKAKERGVDGVMNYCIDPGQKPYQQICEKMGLPCVASFEQFDIMTNKDKFAEYCGKYGVGTIHEYDLDGEFTKENLEKIELPVLVKPADGRASKGITICNKVEDIPLAYEYAMSFSKRKKVLIQTYVRNCPEICAKYVACDGEIFLTTMADVFTCYKEDGTRVYLGTQTYPSKYMDEYLRTTNDRVINMLKSIGVRNGATSFTGFFDNGVFRMFDPSLRMGGAQDWRIAAAASGVDISDLLTNYAMTGSMGDVNEIRKIDKAFAKKFSALLYFDVLPGKIGVIKGIEDALEYKGVVGYHQCHKEGDLIEGLGTANNVAIRFILSCNTKEQFVNTILKVQSCISILNEEGESMMAPLFDVNNLN